MVFLVKNQLGISNREARMSKRKVFVILAVVCALLIGAAVFFANDGPERVRYARYGFPVFSMDPNKTQDLEISKTCSFQVSRDSVGVEDMTVLELGFGGKLVLTDVKRDETGYILYITSVGVFEFDGGQILLLNCPDRVIETEAGSVTLAIRGRDSDGKNAIRFSFYLYPDSDISAEELDLLVIPVTFEAEDMTLRIFSRE